MKKITIILLLILITGLASSQNFEKSEKEKLAVNVTFYNDSEPEINGVSNIETERVTAFSEEGTHQIKTINEQSETVFEGSVNLAFRSPKGFGSSEYETTDSISRQLFIDFQREATEIKVEGPRGEDSKDLVESICDLQGECTEYCRENDAEVLSCTCGDGVCQEELGEQEFCREDCLETRETGGEEKATEGFRSPWLYIGVFLALVLAALIVYSSVEVESDDKEGPV